jgi:hypothetical protein
MQMGCEWPETALKSYDVTENLCKNVCWRVRRSNRRSKNYASSYCFLKCRRHLGKNTPATLEST